MSKSLSDTSAQPAPKPNDKPAAWSLVMRDMVDRDLFGAEKYKVRLQPSNGRDFLMDAYQEALDLVVYLRGAIYERDDASSAVAMPAGQWIKWSGGYCPVPGLTMVECKLRNGASDEAVAGSLEWDHCAEVPGVDVVAYRIVKAAS